MIFFTGGSGVLGRHLVPLLGAVHAPTSSEVDVTNLEQVLAALGELQPSLIVHAAAFTDVTRAETERELAWRVNVEGTRNVAQAARHYDIPLVHISTDYVFSGRSAPAGGFSETDVPGPVINYYSLTKLVAEEAARQHDDALIVRTSFRPSEWPYHTAFTDVITSQDYVDIIAPLLAQVVQHLSRVPVHTLHVATEAKSVFALAQRRKPNVQPGKRASAPVALPANVALNTSLFHTLRKGFHDEHDSNPFVAPWSETI